jgi:steroid delta-isomerase-like uncharacterized protein
MGQSRDVAEQYFKAVDASDLEAVRTVLHPDVDFAAPGPVVGNADVQVGWMQPFLAAFPDLEHRIVSAVERDGTVAAEVTITGTFTKSLSSPQGEIPPTNRRMELMAANVFGVRDGRITLHHIYFDQMAMLGQLGLLPPP